MQGKTRPIPSINNMNLSSSSEESSSSDEAGEEEKEDVTSSDGDGGMSKIIHAVAAKVT